jgi:chromosome segregation ATPase
MKTITKILKNDIGVSESVLKRTKATGLDLAVLSEQLQDLKTDTCRDLDTSRSRIQALDEQMMAVDGVIHSIDHNIGQCQTVVLAVKETLESETGHITTALRQAEEEHQGRYAVLDERINAVDAVIRSIEEKQAQQQEAVHNRIQALEERMPQMESEMKALVVNAERIEQFQQRINARIVTVMKMSLAIIGVLIVTTIVLGVFFFK